MPIKNCLKCNKEMKVKPSQMERKKYCSKECMSKYLKENMDYECRKYIKGKDVQCKFCGKIFYRKNSEIKENNYCSKDCLHKGMIKPNKKKSKTRKTIEKKCKFCNKPFMVENSYKDKREYCTQKCFTNSRKGIPTGKADPSLKEKYKINCTNCGKVFLKTPSQQLKNKYHFCSIDCMGVYYKKAMLFTGENSGTWTGGSDKYYGENWHEQRRKARERDNYTCQDCGITEEEYGIELSVHHLKLFRLFDDYIEANKLENLICVCEPCHRKRHTGENHPVNIYKNL